MRYIVASVTLLGGLQQFDWRDKMMSIGKIVKTQNVKEDRVALDAKMKQIHPKLFGLFCPFKYELLKTENVLVPYLFMIFDYETGRKDKLETKSKLLGKTGQIGVVYDMNEKHAFHFDLYDDLALQESKITNIKSKLLEPKCSEHDAVSESIECAKWQYLRRSLYSIPSVSLSSKRFFYREAIELTLECRGQTYTKYAYKDNFATENEHISGLKVRLNI